MFCIVGPVSALIQLGVVACIDVCAVLATCMWLDAERDKCLPGCMAGLRQMSA